MNKTLIEVIIVVILASSLGGFAYYKKQKFTPLVSVCPTDVMMCPDGTSVPRSGAACEFDVCKQELPSYMIPVTSQTETSEATATSQGASTSLSTKKTPAIPATDNVIKKITTSATSLIKQVTTSIANSLTTQNKQTNQNQPSTQITNTQTNTLSQPNPLAINETRYLVVNGSIVDQNNKVIFTLPTTFTGSSGTNYGSTHAVNAVAVNQVAPIIGTVPVNGLPGKYYLSVNSVGNKGACEFSNRIFILDVNTGVQTLMYEENNTMLSPNDPRACTNEMYLLATEGPKLILKYHTTGTNSTCDSTWSEPELTWYLDVTDLSKGTRRYYITGTQYGEAEKKEIQCRVQYDASSTVPVQTGVAG